MSAIDWIDIGSGLWAVGLVWLVWQVWKAPVIDWPPRDDDETDQTT